MKSGSTAAKSKHLLSVSAYIDTMELITRGLSEVALANGVITPSEQLSTSMLTKIRWGAEKGTCLILQYVLSNGRVLDGAVTIADEKTPCTSSSATTESIP